MGVDSIDLRGLLGALLTCLLQLSSPVSVILLTCLLQLVYLSPSSPERQVTCVTRTTTDRTEKCLPGS